MKLFDLTLRNVQRNFRLYTIYLVSMIIGVVIHFTFSSLMFNRDILDMLENRRNFRNGVMIASIVVFLFIIFFILYANSFFMRQRQKEFGLYLLLGLQERQLTLMVFYETLILSSISLAAGIGLGGLLSKLFGMLLVNLMQYDQVISLSFPLPAIGTTVALFLALAVIISIQSHYAIRRVQLMELFHAKEKMEKPIAFSGLLALLSILLLAQACMIISRGIKSVIWQDYPLFGMIAVTVGIIGGTYLFFRQFVGWLLAAISRGKNYFEGNTVLWTSSLRFQVQGNTANLTFISLTGLAVILLTCFVVINYKVQFDSVEQNIPNHIAFQSLDAERNNKIQAMIQSSEHGIKDYRTLEAVAAQPVTDMKQAFDEPEYFMPELLVVPVNAYNELTVLRGGDQPLKLEGQEAVSLAKGTNLAQIYEPGTAPEFKIRAGSEAALHLVEKKDYALLGWSTIPGSSRGKKPAVIVVSDGMYQQLRVDAEVRSFELYQIGNATRGEALSREIQAIVRQVPEAYYSSFPDVYSAQIESSSLLLFSGAFLALISVFALASVIYFRQLRVATEEQQQYAILRKIGVESRQMRSVIRKQLLFIFAPPLVLAVWHSWFIIKYYLLETLTEYPGLSDAVWGILGVYFLVYVLFYLSSANLYYKIVNQHVR
ncbi:MAG: hypothetical protein K0R57_4527 [Paenibacillaceae bacterium]|jgi:putative ABC transport system permease protein|nr:hypothetical protein [Paenibacillaceae bacterium]